MNNFDLVKEQEGANKYYCEICYYNAVKKFNYERHLLTDKHKKIKNDYERAKTSKSNKNIIYKSYECDCGKSYKHQTNLTRHKKTTCIYSKNIKPENKIIEKSENETDYKELIMTLINENKEMRKTISELVPKIGNTTNNTTLNTTNNNITNNANFNMNIFLNEQCKDALRLDDFINQIEVSISNLLLTKDKGLIDGISNIFIENMNKLSLYERPVHCTDLKRETLYIKQDEWIKDKDNSIVKDAIKKVSRIQSKNINKWSSQNPDYLTKPEKQTEFIKLVKNTTDDLDGKQDKIIKNICKTVYINEKTIKNTDN